MPPEDRSLRTLPEVDDEQSRERVLMGGRTTVGVVMVGDTVRRPATGNSDFVRRLLQHLERAGFNGAPRAHPPDERGRDVFSFVEGEVPSDLSHHDDEILTEAARLIWRYHDASAGLAASLRSGETAEVVCHNDLSPCNFVFRDGRPMSIIDFDAAATGPRHHDLGYAAWLWLDLGNVDIAAAEQRRRLRLFLGAYGGEAMGEATIIAAALRRQAALADEARRSAN